jgi:GYF domain 2
MKYAIYISKNGEVTGPFTKKELRDAVHSKNVSCNDWAWHKELPEWKPVHAVIPIIHVSRNGEEIAQFDEEKEILSGLRDGTLLMDDYYWCEGMSDWKPLSTLEISKGALATTAQKDALKRAGLPFDDLTTKAQVSALFSAGKTGPNDPATENQKDYLRSFGITAKEGLTKGEASELIDRAKDDPAALETRNRLQLAKYEEQRTRETEFPSYHLKQMIASAVKDLEEAKKEKREARALLTNRKNKVAAAQQKRANATDEFEQLSLDNEIKDLENEASEAEEAFDNVSVEEAKDELKYESGLRIKFWKATFPSGRHSLNIEDWEGLADYNEAISRYSEFGRHFKVPTYKQISDVLATLDAESSDWDKTEPERFYETLAALFPETKQRPVVRASKSGCLVLLLILAALVSILVTIAAQ